MSDNDDLKYSTKLLSPPKTDFTGLVKSGSRVLDVFEYFRNRRLPAREVDIRNMLNLPKSSTNDLLKTMAARGYLNYDEEARTYFPSFRVARMGDWVADHYFGANRLPALLDELSRETGAVVVLSEPGHYKMQIVAIEERFPSSAASMEGQLIDMVGTATGRAFLMTRNEEDVMRIATRAARWRPAERNSTALRAFAGMIDSFKRQHYSVSRVQSMGNDTLTLGMPLPAHGSRLPLFLGVGGPSQGVMSNETKIVDMMSKVVASYIATPQQRPHSHGRA